MFEPVRNAFERLTTNLCEMVLKVTTNGYANDLKGPRTYMRNGFGRLTTNLCEMVLKGDQEPICEVV